MSNGTRVKDWPEIEDFQDLLDTAEAEAREGYEQDFVADMLKLYARWGQEMYLSDRQKETLERIANK